MEFTRFTASDILKPYIESYFLFESDSDAAFNDTVFPSGNVEVIFNLGSGIWEFETDHKFQETPDIELWGQITKPLAIRSSGRHIMFGIRFRTHAAACFFKDEIGMFNDHVTDLADVLGNSVKRLREQLLETPVTADRIRLAEDFLLNRLKAFENKSSVVNKVADILKSIQWNSSSASINEIASNYGLTPRYLHKLVYHHTGLSPKSFDKINRFQRSLRLLSGHRSLTDVAYDCGYFDQSHFIRDFKSFTSFTPSDYLERNLPVNQLFL